MRSTTQPSAARRSQARAGVRGVSVIRETPANMIFLFWFGILLTAIAPVVIGIGFDNSSTSWVAALCGAFIAFMAKLENIAELSLGPVKAKMKEKIEEATATAESLRNIATVTSEGFLTDLMAGNFMGGISLEKRFELHDKLVEALKDIGASEEQIRAAESHWNKGVGIIYHRAVKKAVEERTDPSQVNPDAPVNKKEAGKEIQELLNFKQWEAPSPHTLRTVLKKHEVESSEAEAWIDDYEHFLETGEIRNKAALLEE